jgi:hypothetical protein
MRRLSRPDPATAAAMKAAVEAYRGPVTKCPPGVARAHEVKISYSYEPPRPEKPVWPGAGNGNGRQPGKSS